ncbi:unnamed protein product [Phytophthora fragariaefolia]|uniref:Unnamed protein product n=1 Tax=Phytophthora fragariaefolia TaxID=1490495 RepID=A0A9W6X8V2_9STRA|nr:unnamed protein product [Phytophthora fragariaefolia]
MALPDDDRTLEAALSFLDEFPFDDECLSATQTAVATTRKNEVALVPRGSNAVFTANAPDNETMLAGDKLSTPTVYAPRCKAPLLLGSVEDDTAKRKKINERKKLLRKTGVYGDPNRARNARRLEIAYLKEQLEKLQTDLQALQGQKERPKEKSAAQHSLTTVVSTVQIPSMWQAVADSQRKRREAAELENVRLKLILDRQQKMADNLRALIQKRASQLVRH